MFLETITIESLNLMTHIRGVLIGAESQRHAPSLSSSPCLSSRSVRELAGGAGQGHRVPSYLFTGETIKKRAVAAVS